MKLILVSLLTAFAAHAPTALAHPGGHGADAELPDSRSFGRPSAPRAVEKAYGRGGDATKASRTVPIEMTAKGGCAPATIPVKQGETLRLVARNAGSSEQDLALGTASDLKAHAEMVRKFPQMQASLSNRITVKPGESRELVWQFTKAGEFNLACAAPGRFDAASAGKIVVTAQ